MLITCCIVISIWNRLCKEKWNYYLNTNKDTCDSPVVDDCKNKLENPPDMRSCVINKKDYNFGLRGKCGSWPAKEKAKIQSFFTFIRYFFVVSGIRRFFFSKLLTVVSLYKHRVRASFLRTCTYVTKD